MGKIILGLAMIFSSSAFSEIICSNAMIDAETSVIEGEWGNKDNIGLLIYYGPTDGNADNKGTYVFKSETSLIMMFAGEARHFCTKTGTDTWACKRGKSARALKYNMTCKYER